MQKWNFLFSLHSLSTAHILPNFWNKSQEKSSRTFSSHFATSLQRRFLLPCEHIIPKLYKIVPKVSQFETKSHFTQLLLISPSRAKATRPTMSKLQILSRIYTIFKNINRGLESWLMIENTLSWIQVTLYLAKAHWIECRDITGNSSSIPSQIISPLSIPLVILFSVCV